MPVKNAARWLNKLLESIQIQTFQNWELIAIDDHSDDASFEILASMAETDDRINVLKNAGDGIIPALQSALSKASGTYITRMDADDLMPENRLDLMIAKIKESPAKTIVTGLVKYFGTDEISEGYQAYEHWLNDINLQGDQWKNVYRECVVASPNWMMRTANLESLGGFDELSYPEDYHFVLKWYQNDFDIKVIPEVTLLWREHPDRTSRTSTDYDQAHFFQLKIREFLNWEWNQFPLVLWGKNPKATLTAKLLKKNQIDFEWMDLKDYCKIEAFASSQLLVAVYPENSERVALESYLNQISRVEGKDWWYL